MFVKVDAIKPGIKIPAGRYLGYVDGTLLAVRVTARITGVGAVMELFEGRKISPRSFTPSLIRMSWLYSISIP